MILKIFYLLITFQINHFLADYIFQNGWMVKGKHAEKGWVSPLASHALVHAAMTWTTAMLWTWYDDRWQVVFLRWQVVFLCFGVAALDFVVHFTMDRVKASPNLLGRWKCLSAREFRALPSMSLTQDTWYERDGGGWTNNGPLVVRERVRSNALFWWTLGLDQMVHHLTHYAIIWILVTQ